LLELHSKSFELRTAAALAWSQQRRVDWEKVSPLMVF
jgi:hypothetical protein